MSGPQGHNILGQALEMFIRHGWEMTRERRAEELQSLANMLFSWQQQHAAYRSHCEGLSIQPGIPFTAFGRKEGGEELQVEQIPALPRHRLFHPLNSLPERPGTQVFKARETLGFRVTEHDLGLAQHSAFARFVRRCPEPALRALAPLKHAQTPKRLPMLVLTSSEGTDFFHHCAQQLVQRWGKANASLMATGDVAANWLQKHATTPVVIVGRPTAWSELLEAHPAGRALHKGSAALIGVSPEHSAADTLHGDIARALQLPAWAAFYQYTALGLTSPLYDPSFLCKSAIERDGARVLVPPPWCTLSIHEPDEDGHGEVRVLDCANIDAVSAVLTGSMGSWEDGRLVVLAPDDDASISRET